MDIADYNLAKLAIPSVTKAIDRERLHRLLEDHDECSVIWLSGPTGSGKTTFAAQLSTRSSPAAALWYRLDASDEDPAALFHFLQVAVCKAAAGRDEMRAPTFGREHAAGMSLFARNFFRSNFSRLPHPFAIVFDDAHTLSEASPALQILRACADELPPRCRMLVISRRDPAADFVELIIKKSLLLLDWQLLRFDREEAKLLLCCNGSPPPSEQRTDRLLQLTQGWVAGLALLADGPADPLSLSGFDAATTETLSIYIGKQIFDRLDADEQDLLLRVSPSPWISAEIVRRVTDNDRADRVLEALSRRCCSFVSRSSDGQVFDIHPLFRLFLQNRSAVVLGERKVAQLIASIVDVLVDEGHLDAAIPLVLKVEDWQRLEMLLCSHAPRLAAQARFQTLATWLRAVPRTVMNERLWLQYWVGVAESWSDPSGAERILARAYDQFMQRADSCGAYSSWAAIVELQTHFIVYGKSLDHWLGELPRLRRAHPCYPTKEIECRVAISMLGALACRRSADPKVAQWFGRAMTLAGELKLRHLAGMACLYRLHTLVALPKSRERLAIVDQLAIACREPDCPDLVRLLLKLDETCVLCNTGQYDAALAAAEDGLALSERSGIVTYIPLLLARKGLCLLGTGRSAEARNIIAQLASLDRAGPELGRGAYRYLQGVDCYLAGDTDGAVAQFESALAVVGDGESFAHLIVRLSLAMALAAMGETSQAAAHVRSGLGIAERVGSASLLYHCHLLMSLLALNEGDEGKACRHLDRAFAVGRTETLDHALLWRAADLSRLCAVALEAGIAVDVVGALIRERRLRPPAGCDVGWLCEVLITCLGGFRIERAGEVMTFAPRAQRKPLDLLRALIAYGGQDVAIERLQDALWPDADGDAAQRAFDTTLHRLRRLIGVDGALMLSEGRLSLDPQLCQVDVLRLRTVIQRVSPALRSGRACAGERVVDAAERTIGSLYAGDFLFGVSDAPWALAHRRTIRGLVAQFFVELGQSYERQGRLQEGADCYERASAIEAQTDDGDLPLMAQTGLRKKRQAAHALAPTRPRPAFSMSGTAQYLRMGARPTSS